jgi:CubicO group peptidase (beta-lactamase class C family)
VAFVDGYNTVPERAYGTVWRDDRYVVEDQYAYSPVLGDGGIYSSIHDLYLWDQALAENKLISADRMKEAMKTAKPIKDSKGVSYSCGWYVEEVKGHQYDSDLRRHHRLQHMFIPFSQ